MTDKQETNVKSTFDLINAIAVARMMSGDRKMTYVLDKHMDPIVTANVIDKLSLRFRVEEKKSWRGNTKLIITF